MPWIHDALWLFFFATLAFVAWKAAERFNLRVPAFDLRKAFGGSVPAAGAGTWYPPATRSSGNTAFDDWRDAEIARLESERQKLEIRLHAFEAFVDKLKRAKDRETFDRFMADYRELPLGTVEPMMRQTEDAGDHHPA